MAKEVEQHGDIVFVNHKTNYKSILYKTYFVLEYAVTNYNVKFVLKTDDDAFINVAPLMHQLHMLCVTPDCQNERIYMGKMAKESEVLLQPGHKWNNIVFHNHTGTLTYTPLCMLSSRVYTLRHGSTVLLRCANPIKHSGPVCPSAVATKRLPKGTLAWVVERLAS